MAHPREMDNISSVIIDVLLCKPKSNEIHTDTLITMCILVMTQLNVKHLHSVQLLDIH